MPFFNMGLTREDVEDFWGQQSWALELDSKDGLSNCTYCFLKGLRVLQNAQAALGTIVEEELENTPCDLNWWVSLEQKYGRDMEAEKRQIRREIPNGFIGFFGAKSAFSYQRLAEAPRTKDSLAGFEDSVLPCDCTD